MFIFSKKNRASFLNRMGYDMKIKKLNTNNWVDLRAIPERTEVNDDNTVSFTLYITADVDDVSQDDSIFLNNEYFTISYINDDLSGLVNCYLTLTGDTNGRTSKYI